MIKGNAMVPKVCRAQTPKWRCRRNFRKEKLMKVLRVVFTVALFSAGVAVANDRGISVDPNGGTHGAAAVAVAGDKGLGVDPNGGTQAAVPDQGVCIDPNGRCAHAAATGDDGMGIDPNGRVQAADVDDGIGIDPHGGGRHCRHGPPASRGGAPFDPLPWYYAFTMPLPQSKSPPQSKPQTKSRRKLKAASEAEAP